jgi:hypothetical protein
MSNEIKVESAVEFLEFLFGKTPNGVILTRRLHPDPPEGARDTKDPHYNKLSHWAKPGSLEKSTEWQRRAADWHNFVLTATFKSNESTRKDGEYVEVPALWFDLDALKKLPIRADDVYQEIVDSGEVDCVVRSSEKGIQGWFKLDESFQCENGKKAGFNTHVKPILYNIAYAFGADFAVCTSGNMMRLPGTYNVKPEYEEPYRIRARYVPNKPRSLATFAQKYKTNINIVPLPAWLGIAFLAERVWENGMRHQLCIDLCGTVRKAGMDRESCRELIRKVFGYLKHEAVEDELPTVETTYDLDLNDPTTRITTLYTNFPDIAKKVEKICDWWVKYKEEYCKRLRVSWKPDNYDPREDPDKPKGTFWTDNGQTFYMAVAKDVPYEKLFANFSIRMRGNLYDPVSQEGVMVGEITTPGQHPRLIEMPPKDHTSWDKFCGIRNLPPGVACFDKTMWQEYIGHLAKENMDKPNRTKVRYYGFFDVKTKPSLVMPGAESDHPQYTWLPTGTDTAADPKVFMRKLESDDIKEYLRQFGEHYPHYHEQRYIFPVLGWFMGSIISAFLRNQLDGFPTLVITGLAGSGKSTLINKVMIPHFGLNTSFGFGKLSPFALARMLTANNILPCVVDEFRDRNEFKTGDLQDTILNLWDSSARGFGVGGGKTEYEKLVGNLCLMGEHPQADEATLHRTYVITLNRDWLEHLQQQDDAGKAKLESHRMWLEGQQDKGLLGAITLQWVTENYDVLPEIIERAKEMVMASTPTENPRKNDGFTAIVAGLLLMASIYQDYGLPFFIGKKTLLKSLYTADANLGDFQTYDTNVMRTLFQNTDLQIMQSIRATGKTPEGQVYHFDMKDPNVIHFELTRWHGLIAPLLRKTNSAALAQLGTFIDVLRDNVKDDSSIVAGFDKSPVFKRNSVAIRLDLAAEKYNINVEQWKNLEQLMDEMENR